MVQVTIRKYLRWFVLIEFVGLAIAVAGLLLDGNGCIISLGLLMMMFGLTFLSMAGALKVQERSLEAAQQHLQTEEEQAPEDEGD
jgi:phosphatidylglycerophosphate synthase